VCLVKVGVSEAGRLRCVVGRRGLHAPVVKISGTLRWVSQGLPTSSTTSAESTPSAAEAAAQSGYRHATAEALSAAEATHGSERPTSHAAPAKASKRATTASEWTATKTTAPERAAETAGTSKSAETAAEPAHASEAHAVLLWVDPLHC